MEHYDGKVRSTKGRTSFELIYYEASKEQRDAFKREKYLKSAYGRRYIKNRLSEYFTG